MNVRQSSSSESTARLSRQLWTGCYAVDKVDHQSERSVAGTSSAAAAGLLLLTCYRLATLSDTNLGYFSHVVGELSSKNWQLCAADQPR